MSDYPPPPAPPYGASCGSQDQTNPPYLPPTYPNQYMQANNGRTGLHAASNYDTSMSAYGYNNSMPGFSAGALASGPAPLPIFQGWNQDAIPLPSYTVPHNNMQHTGYVHNNYQNPQSYPVHPSPPTYQQNSQHVKPHDEGELSEGEFEDAYAAQNTAPHAATDYRSNYYRGNDGTGYMDTAHRAVYPRNQDYNGRQYVAPGMSLRNHS